MSTTNKTLVAAAVTAAIALVGTTTPTEVEAARANMEKCYGVAKTGKNDCGTPTHACAGQASKDRDPEEWIYLPKGSCDKIAGGKTK
jgi:uncharacterized membrane protein